MNFAELTTRVAQFTHRTDLSSVMSVFVEHAEARINRDLRVRQMELPLPSTAINSSGEVALPTGFLAFKRVWPSATPETTIEPQPLDYVKGRAGNTSPFYYALSGTAAVFDGVGSISATYYSAVPSLQGGENWLSTSAPDLYLHATIAAAAAIYLRDTELAAISDTQAQTLIDRMNQVDKRDRFGGPLTSRKS